jgi:hypothetical protein
MTNGLINQILWKDNFLALFFSTVYTADEEMVKRRRARPKTKTASVAFGSAPEKVFDVPLFGDMYNFQKGELTVVINFTVTTHTHGRFEDRTTTHSSYTSS